MSAGVEAARGVIEEHGRSGTIASPWRAGRTGAPRPPLASGLPLLGHVLQLSGDVLPFVLACHRRLGPIFRLRAPRAEWVCLVGPEANQFMTHSGYEYVTTGASYQGFNEAFHSTSFLITLDGPRHAHLRRIERRAFSREALDRQLPAAVTLVDRRIAGWPDGGKIDIIRELKALVVGHLGLTLTGRDASQMLGDIQTVLDHIVGITQLKLWPRILFALPPFRRARARLHADIAAVVEAHRGRPPTPGGEDLIDDMLRASTLDGQPLPDETIFAATMGAYMAGLDTAAIIATFLLYAILRHPHVHRRVQPEIDALFAQGPISWARIREMTAFRGAVMEALRLYPVVGLLPREAARDFEFCGRQIHRGDQLFVAVTAAHFDPKIYVKPEVFDIDRHAPPRSEHRRPGAFAPFGLGEHRCLGANMGELQAMIVVATLLHRLELALDPLDYALRIVAKPLRRPDARLRIRVLGRRA